METNGNRKIRLGMMLPNAKKKKIRLPERIQDRCKEENIEIVDLGMDTNFDDVGGFDVFLHKAVDFHSEGYKDEQTVLDKIEKFKKFLNKFPDMIIIDDILLCEKLLERNFQIELLQQCAMTVDNIEVFTPKTLEISPGTTIEEVRKAVASNSINFPILAKPVWATQKEGSHSMTMIFNEEHLNDLPIPCIMQEFHNHGSIVYKVYVIGDRFNICERPSVKDVDYSSTKTLFFDTRNVSKTGRAYLPDIHGIDPNKRKWRSCDDDPNLLNRNVVEALRRKVSDLTKMGFYGMDILVDSITGNYAFVDLNQFPGFTGIGNHHFVENLIHYIKQCVAKK